MANGGSLDFLEELLAFGRDSRWALTLNGEKPWNVLQELLHDLQIPEGKKIATKFSYIGMAPTIAWANACSDLFYPVMRDSIHGFERYWRPVSAHLGDGPYHFISLGVGTGQKDRVVLYDLHPRNPKMLYMPVDISSDMIRLGIDETKKLRDLRLLPVQLDFATTSHLEDLKRLAHQLVGDEPILYGILGNTVANVDEDAELMTGIGELLRPQDRLLLELSTSTDISDEALREATGEYANSGAYRLHATSALGQFTDLTIDNRNLRFRSSIEDDRTIRIETHYENASGAPMVVMLPNQTPIDFADGETIRLTLSRKYQHAGIDALISGAGLTRLDERTPPRQSRTRHPVFSRELMMLARTPAGPRKPSVADDLLRTGKPVRR